MQIFFRWKRAHDSHDWWTAREVLMELEKLATRPTRSAPVNTPDVDDD
jgi:hypothetical protein